MSSFISNIAAHLYSYGNLRWTESPMTAILLKSTASPLPSSSLPELLLHEINASSYMRQPVTGREVIFDPYFVYLKAARPQWNNIVGDSVKYIVIADLSRYIPVAVFTIAEITTTGPDLIICWDAVALQQIVLNRTDYILHQISELQELNHIDNNPDRTTQMILSEVAAPNQVLFSLIATAGGDGIAPILNYRSQPYDMLFSNYDAIDFNYRRIEEVVNDPDKPLLALVTTAGAEAIAPVFTYPRLQAVDGIELKYNTSGDVYIPTISAKRVDNTLEVDILNPRPGYKLRAFMAQSQAGASMSFSMILDNISMDDLPIVISDINTSLNYAIKLQMYLEGSIDGVPVIQYGSKSAPRYDIVVSI